MAYEVKLERFEGPLDLLLHLIQRDEIDIYDPDLYVDGPIHEIFTELRRTDPVHWQPMPDEPGPPGLKKISVIHYLTSLVPVPMSEGPFAVLAEPTPAWIAVPSLLLFTAVVLFLAGLHIRRMEISYAGD